MTAPSRAELRRWAAQLRPDVPLDVDKPEDRQLYVELAETGRGEVDDMQATIELSYTATTQLLTGPSGSGKTTELYRLRRDLGFVGYAATIVPITDYVSESSPLDITEFLIALAVGAHDALGEKPDRPGFVARLGGLLRRLNVDLDIAGVTAKVSADGIEMGAAGSTVGLNLGDEIKASRPFVDQLRRKLSYHIKPLYDEVATFLTDLLPAAETAGAVLIVDGLEKLRGTSDDDVDVQRSIEALFVNHASKLRFASHHMVYTVPTYLQFISPGALPFDSRQFVPVPHLRTRAGDRDAATERNLGELREVARRRIPVDRIFGDTDLLDDVLLASGGHLRDIFRILLQLMNLTLRLGLELPVRREHVAEAIGLVARGFATVTREQAEFLYEVDLADGSVRPDEENVQLMARLLQSHMLLAHRNDEEWYEVHPLARRLLPRL